MDKLKLAYVYSKSGCDFWRSYIPAKEMERRGVAEVRWIDARTMTKSQLASDLRWSNGIVGRGLCSIEGLVALREWQSVRPVFVDYDDLFFNVSPFNPAYKHFGLEEIHVEDPITKDQKPLWLDGQNGFSIKANTHKFYAYKDILKEASLITTTTPYLKAGLAEYKGDDQGIAVCPNAVDFERWRPIPDVREKYEDEFRFGWAVSSSHGEDWLYIKPALVKFLETHPKAKFVCIGDTHIDITKGLPVGQVEWVPSSDLWEGHYAVRMACLGLDVAIAPLAHNEFNRCKSPLKYAEYTGFGWPVIAEKMTPYDNVIVGGDNGMLAGTIDEWCSCLDALYRDKGLRAKLHYGAVTTCKALFDVKRVYKDWANAYSQVIFGEKICKF